MKQRIAALTGAVLAAACGLADAATGLYDPSLGTLPSQQGWSTAGTPGFTQSVSDVYRFDTRLADGVMAGSTLNLPTAFDTVGGFELDFSLRIVSETHARPERGGFSIIVTGNDPAHALELAFWDDRVFAYTPSFARGAEAMSTTTATTAYSLVVASDRYTLLGDGRTLLSGTLVDYGAFGVPYSQPGFLFFGDDTSTARANVEVGRIALIAAVPEPSSAALLVAGLMLLALAGPLRRPMRRDASADRDVPIGQARGIGRGLPSWSIAT